MSVITYLYSGLFYFATCILVVGVARKIYIYSKTPAPLKIPTTPAPTTKMGVVARIFREVVFFQSLFKASKWTWIFGWVFHFAFLLIVLHHLRYFTEPIWSFVVLLQTVEIYAGYLMIFGLMGLWARRFFVDRVRYISALSDHLMLLLLIAIAGTGLLMRTVFYIDIVSLRAFTLGLLQFQINPLPHDPILLIHLALVILLMMIFPISKLLHVPGLFFSPTLNQVDNSREVRHVSRTSK